MFQWSATLRTIASKPTTCWTSCRDDKIPAVRTLLEAMIEPIARSLASTVVDHEEPTPETIAAIKKGRGCLARGEGVPHEDVLREFGFKK